MSVRPFSYPISRSKSARRQSYFVLAFSLAVLIIGTACSSNNNINTTVTCPGATGNYSNASLPAGSQWTYELSGWISDSNTGNFVPYTSAGTFVADGNGNITSGFDEAFGGTISGTYSIINNGTGTMNVTVTSSGGTTALTWGITLSNANPGSVYLIEEDSGINSAGTAYQQSPNVATSPASFLPNGTFVFRNHVISSATTGDAGSSARVGVMTVSAGTVDIPSFSEDLLIAGLSPTQPTLSAANFTAPGSGGMGQFTLADSSGSYTFDYFVIDQNNFILYETDANNGGLALGKMEMQSNPGTYSTASLPTGMGYVFNSHGDTQAVGAGGVDSVGQFTTDGAGGITGGSYDTVRDGGASLGIALTSSSYSVQANGRASITVNGPSPAVGQTAYLVSPTRGFFLVNSDPTRVEDGTLEQQTTTSFSTGNFNGQAAFVMSGQMIASSTSSGDIIDRTGTVTSDGNGNLGWAEVVNSAAGGGASVPGCLSGTYTVGSNGRVLASVNSVSSNLIFYMVSPAKLYVIQGDSTVQIYGGASVQASPVIDPPGSF